MDEILPETERITFPVQMGGRRFPSEPNLPRWATPERVRELKMQPLEQGMPQRLAEAILQRLPWKKIKLIENPDRHTVVTAYIDSIKELDTYRDDVLRLIEEACRANLEFWQRAGETHAEARDAVLGRNLGEMMAAAAYYWLPAKSIAGARTAFQAAGSLLPPNRHISLECGRQFFPSTVRTTRRACRSGIVRSCGMVAESLLSVSLLSQVCVSGRS